MLVVLFYLGHPKTRHVELRETYPRRTAEIHKYNIFALVFYEKLFYGWFFTFLPNNMSLSTASVRPIDKASFLSKYSYLIRGFFAGTLLTLGFAPFHFPGLAILGLAIIFGELQNKTLKQATRFAFTFAATFMTFGVSWIFVSIHMYGNLNIFISTCVTISFILYLTTFFILQAVSFNYLQRNRSLIFSSLIFAATWCLSEYLRATFATGFPWLLVGFGQIDSPLQHLLPIIGVYGVSFMTCLAGALLYCATEGYLRTQNTHSLHNLPYLIAFLSILLAPLLLKNLHPMQTNKKSINIGVIQANLSMRDKWDDDIFAQIINRYRNGINDLKTKASLIILPESAIPVPEAYVTDFIDELNFLTLKHNNSILMGIPHAANSDESLYYNTLTYFGSSNGSYHKQHLVPFGEYIPKPFNRITEALGVPDASMTKGSDKQQLLKFKQHSFASLICFEVAYPEILRKQLPKAEWIISASDAGWFGRSLAIYQQLQMSQVLSALTGRYQIVANNNGLSSIIDAKGQIINSLPAFSSMDLYGSIRPAHGETIWVTYGDMPYLYLCIVIIIIAFVNKRSYSYRSTLP